MKTNTRRRENEKQRCRGRREDVYKRQRQNGVNIGRNRLFTKLREGGFLSTQKGSWNKPLQWTMEQGYFEIEEGFFDRPLGGEGKMLWSVTRVTPVGLSLIHILMMIWLHL